jgi:thiol-disulfide isomerase/thioredoxin
MEAKKVRIAELAANVAIVVVALVVIAVVVKRNLLGSRDPGRHQISAGEKISVPGVDWSSHDKTVVLALAQGCHFCSESAPFYQRLVQTVRANADTELAAVLPQEDAEAHKYVESLGLKIDDIRKVSLEFIGVAGTPTLILVDRGGVVRKVWVGQLPPEKESEVISSVSSTK